MVKFKQKLKSILFRSTILPYVSSSLTFIFCKLTGPKYSRGVVVIFKLFCETTVNDPPDKEIRANMFLFNKDSLNTL